MHMKVPGTSNEWKLVAENFVQRWDFPHFLGAIDGKHVVMKAASNTGPLYYNYKGTFSTVLMALVDSNYKFIAIDVGAYGRNSDGGIFANSNLGKAIASNSLHFPADAGLPGADQLPYVIIGDEAFPLQEHLLRPFPGTGCQKNKQIYNYRLSRARRIVENTFQILAARWRVYHTKLRVRSQLVNEIIKATCVRHNFLQSQSTPAQVTNLLQEAEDISAEGFENLAGSGNRGGRDAITIRNTFMEYFADFSPVAWQIVHINRGVFTA